MRLIIPTQKIKKIHTAEFKVETLRLADKIRKNQINSNMESFTKQISGPKPYTENFSRSMTRTLKQLKVV